MDICDYWICNFFYFTLWVYSSTPAPEVNCIWLPGCVDSVKDDPTPASIWSNVGLELIVNLIWEVIQFVAVIAVIALIISWILYIISWWDDEKVKKAKSWITWSLVWVLLSISAWWIINMLNKFTIS